MVGHAYGDTIATQDDVRALARSPYHEVRFTDEPDPTDGRHSEYAPGWPVGELFGRIRQEQARIVARHPILVRLPKRRSPSTPD